MKLEYFKILNGRQPYQNRIIIIKLLTTISKTLIIFKSLVCTIVHCPSLTTQRIFCVTLEKF